MGKYWYCGVSVRGVKTIYSYLSDTGEIPCGTYVVVPFGSQNTLRVGAVKSCGEYTADNAPYPVERTKHIVREATAEEYETQPAIPSYYGRDSAENDIDYVNCCIDTEDWDEVFDWALSNIYCPDEAVSQKATECLELCSQHGIVQAALELGALYYTGNIVEQNYKKAYELYKIAADAGILRAICNCGYCFYYSRHQEIDYAKAYEYFSLGALLHNDANCLYKLGDMYLNGYFVTKNENYAFILYQRALYCAQENDKDNGYCIADAQMRVGKCRLYGIGTYKDVEEAHTLLSLALINFYKRREAEPYVRGLIAATKELLAQAQAQLDSKIV